MANFDKYEKAWEKVKDRESFFDELLIKTLQWDFTPENINDCTFDWSADLGISKDEAKHIKSVEQLQKMTTNQEWGIFFVTTSSPNVPITSLRRILRALVPKKRATASSSERPVWNMDDLLFICTHDWENYTFIHFDQPPDKGKVARITSFNRFINEPARTLYEFNMPPLEYPDDPADTANWKRKWLQTFDVEKVTEKFYDEYIDIFERIQNSLKKQSRDEKWAHDYSLQFLNRLMFCYFVQKKNWLNNDQKFLSAFWNIYEESKHEKDTFFKQWLNILFFEAFNDKFRPIYKYFPEEISKALQMAPYLNGGLFEENKLDRLNLFEIADDLIEKAIRFLDRYNFTVSENTPLDREVAVDAEMLGKVYETLVNLSETDDERSSSGIFYTPRTEIDLMCRLSLVDYLTNNLGEKYKTLLYEIVFAFSPDDKKTADKNANKHNLWNQLDTLLKEITILDPACGSGSFLIGMLQVLDDLVMRKNNVLGIEETAYERRKRIIERSLYGVDVKKWAVEVAELRLWLQLVIETELKPAERKLKPLLPNLSFKVRCGDSLVQEIGGINFGHLKSSFDIPKPLQDQLNTLKGEKRKFFQDIRNCTYKKIEDLERAEYLLFRDILKSRMDALANKIKEEKRLASAETQKLFEKDVPDKTSKQVDYESRAEIYREEHEKVKIALDALKEDKNVTFIWNVAFVEIFEGDKKGFDIVIGNPPYVRQERIADPRHDPAKVTVETKRLYKDKLINSVYLLYPKFFGNNLAKPAVKIEARSDLCIYFYFHGLNLLNPNGSFCFITTNSWLDVGYGKNLQEFLLKHSHVKLIIDNQVKRSFVSADVNTIIALLAPPAKKHTVQNFPIARFVMFKMPFDQIMSPVIFEEIESATERKSTPEYKVSPMAQDILLDQGMSVPDDDSPKKKVPV
ncbi:Eco57I restriction-modification methylase domain-containing protein, partial [bacterium]|nr:Eco57I restriction-modification methylase domain-containing protein [bacterium]MBU1025487.1 Eco57I restriction-modification methylase domain-containing protein [bacterium]